MKKNQYSFFLLSFLLQLFLGFNLFAQNLQSGPMVGYSSKKEVMLWVQTKSSALVKFAYWPKDLPTNKRFTAEVKTSQENGFTAHCKATPLEPGTHYVYSIYVDNKEVKRAYPLTFQTQGNWEHRTDPPNFSFLLGSCFYVNDEPYDRSGKAYGGELEIVDEMVKQPSDFMLWLGDNTYMRPGDWYDLTGMHYRHTHTRSLDKLQPFLGNRHHYAIWDDHDYGPNDADRSYFLKDLSLKAFKDFWANPNYGVAGGGTTGGFVWGDVAFFLLDNRWFRSPNSPALGGKREILGEEQINWLLENLVNSKASFNVVCIGGQFINPVAVHENHAQYHEERAYLLRKLEEAKIRNVIFLSGDRHHTVLQKMDRPKNYPLYELTCSPISSTAHAPDSAENAYQVKGTLVTERNFGKMEVSGPLSDRVLKMSIFGVKGDLKWSYEIKSKELR